MLVCETCSDYGVIFLCQPMYVGIGLHRNFDVDHLLHHLEVWDVGRALECAWPGWATYPSRPSHIRIGRAGAIGLTSAPRSTSLLTLNCYAYGLDPACSRSIKQTTQKCVKGCRWAHDRHRGLQAESRAAVRFPVLNKRLKRGGTQNLSALEGATCGKRNAEALTKKGEKAAVGCAPSPPAPRCGQSSPQSSPQPGREGWRVGNILVWWWGVDWIATLMSMN
jgi:hypothetical protein